jgi:iron complex outermembrane receptor protein
MIASRRAFVILLVLLLVPAAVSAADAEEPPAASEKNGRQEASPEAGVSSYEEEIEVRALGPDAEVVALDLETLSTGPASNIAVALGTLPGLSGVRRSLGSFEPVVHGLGWERVQTELNGMPLYGACPARMDPPAFLLTAASAEEVLVVKGLASVSLGPAGTGGRVRVSTDHDRGPEPGRETSPWLRLSFAGDGDRLRGGAGVKGGTDRIDYSLGVEAFEQGDYRSADGTVVPASQRETGGFLSFGHRPGKDHRWSLGAIRQVGEEIAYPSLPMDTDRSESVFYRLGYRFEPMPSGSVLSSIELSAGASILDHLMSNRERTNRAMIEAESVSEARTRSARLSTDWALSPRSRLGAGLDLNALDRDALRTRYYVSSGRTAYDHLWPDVSQDDLGLYAEYLHLPGSAWSLRFGLRYDKIRSEAGAADDPALGGGSIREAYQLFYGPEAALTDRDESLVSGNAVFSRRLGEKLTLQGGLGLASRAAGVTERYFAFALSPGGFLVGNPTLRAERKRELSLGARFEGRRWNASVSGYYYDVEGYILPVLLDPMDLDGDGTLDLIRGFENTDAGLAGLDLTFLCRLSPLWSVPGSLFLVRGEDERRAEPLPEIPPAELRLALRRDIQGRLSGSVELGGRLVARAERIDPDFGENETPGFALWHLRARLEVTRVLSVEAGVENLLDRQYVEHLTREAAGNVPGLSPGQEIPQPGRFVTVALVLAF